jgi:hypothetical protein
VPRDDRIPVVTPAAQRWRLAGIGAVMTAASAALVASRPDGAIGLVAGVAGVVFFGPLSLVLLTRAISRRPPLILSADGFTDRATLAGAGFVPWTAVRGIEEQVFMGRVFVSVQVADRAALLRALPAWKRALLRLNSRFVPGDIFIPNMVLPMPPAELVRTMRAMRREATG